MTNKGLSKELMNDNYAMYVNAYYTTKYPSGNPIVQRYNDYIKEQIDLHPELKGHGFIDWVLMEEHHDFMHDIAIRLWMNLNEDLRFSNRYQIDMYDTYLKYKDSPMLKQMEHMRWNADRSIVGYRSSHESGIKDLKFKLHWMIVPFNQLPEAEQQKDVDVIENMRKLTNTQVIIS